MAGFDWGGLIGAAVSLGSAYLSSKGAKSASKDASKAAQQSSAMDWQIYQDQIKRNQPFYDNGLAAQNRYMQLLGLSPASTGGSSLYYSTAQDGTPIARADLYASDPRYRAAWDNTLQQHQNQWHTGYWSGSDKNLIQGQLESALGPMQQPSSNLSQLQAFDAFRNTPGYQFGLDQGKRAVESSAAARGGLNSGATLKALTKFGNDYADQQGFTPYMNRLAGLFGGAQTAAGQMGSYGTNFANNYGQNLQSAAQARANSTYASNQAWNNGLNSAASFFGDWYGSRNRSQTPTGAGAFGYGWGG